MSLGQTQRVCCAPIPGVLEALRVRLSPRPLNRTPFLGYPTLCLVSSIHRIRYPKKGVGFKGLGIFKIPRQRFARLRQPHAFCVPRTKHQSLNP